MKNIEIPSERDIHKAARRFISIMDEHKVFAFYGEMGAGKTTFIKALCRELDVSDNVSSPTFALVNEYSSPLGMIYHLDLYRIKSIEELYDIGYEDYFYSGNLCLIEWPEKAENLLPPGAVKVFISVEADQRRNMKIEL